MGCARYSTWSTIWQARSQRSVADRIRMKANKQMRRAIKDGKAVALLNQKKKCVACNGSGYYDVAGSPTCAACKGTRHK